MLRGKRLYAELYILKPESKIKCDCCDSIATHQIQKRNVCSDCLQCIKNTNIIDYFDFKGVLEDAKG